LKIKKFIILLGIVLIICIGVFFGTRDKKTNEMDQVKVAEVTHSIFYAPLYVAIENGYFDDENIDLKLTLTSGADKVSAAVLSGDVNIGFAGPESAIYVYENKEEDYLITFAGLTKRDGQFIVSRNKIDDFKITDLYGKEVLAGRKGGMPALNFRNGLKLNAADDDKININENIDFASLTGVFLSGVGDFVNLFELNVIKQNKKTHYSASSSNSKSLFLIFFILNIKPDNITATDI
jgi:NitT/TauT family transport system substrate-binding protein